MKSASAVVVVLGLAVIICLLLWGRGVRDGPTIPVPVSQRSPLHAHPAQAAADDALALPMAGSDKPVAAASQSMLEFFRSCTLVGSGRIETADRDGTYTVRVERNLIGKELDFEATNIGGLYGKQTMDSIWIKPSGAERYAPGAAVIFGWRLSDERLEIMPHASELEAQLVAED